VTLVTFESLGTLGTWWSGVELTFHRHAVILALESLVTFESLGTLGT
jgi:hypothetical protein